MNVSPHIDVLGKPMEFGNSPKNSLLLIKYSNIKYDSIHKRI